MKVSKEQTWIWRVREELDRELEPLTPPERLAYYNTALEQVEAEFGIELHLSKVPAGEPGLDRSSAR